MQSRTKVDVDRPVLDLLVREVLGTDAPVTRVRELTDGMFNAAYGVDLGDGTSVVVKVAPPPGTPVLTYERDLMRAEVDFYRRAAGVVPVPAVLGVDLTRSRVDRDVLVMEHLRGVPLESVRRDLPAAEAATVQRELGAAVARLRGVTGTRFGYDRPDGSLSGDTWSGVLRAMVEALVADADHYRVRLSGRARGLPDLVTAAADVLDAAVPVPVLTHFDLWEGNVFVAPGEDGAPHLEAVVDGERAFWGDPLAELVSTSLFRDPAQATDFLAGYAAEAGEPLDLGPDAQLRLTLYRAYLCLIMTVEGAPRGYGPEGQAGVAFARRRLAAELRTLHRVLG